MQKILAAFAAFTLTISVIAPAMAQAPAPETADAGVRVPAPAQPASSITAAPTPPTYTADECREQICPSAPAPQPQPPNRTGRGGGPLPYVAVAWNGNVPGTLTNARNARPIDFVINQGIHGLGGEGGRADCPDGTQEITTNLRGVPTEEQVVGLGMLVRLYAELDAMHLPQAEGRQVRLTFCYDPNAPLTPPESEDDGGSAPDPQPDQPTSPESEDDGGSAPDPQPDQPTSPESEDDGEDDAQPPFVSFLRDHLSLELDGGVLFGGSGLAGANRHGGFDEGGFIVRPGSQQRLSLIARVGGGTSNFGDGDITDPVSGYVALERARHMTVGGGLRLHLTPRLSLDATAQYERVVTASTNANGNGDGNRANGLVIGGRLNLDLMANRPGYRVRPFIFIGINQHFMLMDLYGDNGDDWRRANSTTGEIGFGLRLGEANRTPDRADRLERRRARLAEAEAD